MNKQKNKVGRPKRPYPREAITIRIEPEVAGAFRAMCDKNNLSQSAMITALVANELSIDKMQV